MSSCSDKDQVEVPKAAGAGAGETVKVGKLRLQNYKNKDEVHVHDDDKKLCFIQSKRTFQLAMDNFLKVQATPNDQSVFSAKGLALAKTG